MYILNEKNYIQSLLLSKEKPDALPMGRFITLLAKLYYTGENDHTALSDVIKKKMLEFNLDNYQEYKYHNKILAVCKDLFEGNTEKDLKEREFIPIYENEIHKINALSNDSQKKIMFTFVAVARYMDCGGWINKKDSKGVSEVFKLANVNITSAKRNELLHELYTKGYITFGKKIDNLNIKVELNDSGEIGYRVKEFDNIGCQYIGNFKKGYRQCRRCGRSYKIKSANDYSGKYCDKCAKEKHKETNRNCMKKTRETEKSVQSPLP